MRSVVRVKEKTVMEGENEKDQSFNVLGDFIFVGPILIVGVGLLIFDKFCLRRVKAEERNERG